MDDGDIVLFLPIVVHPKPACEPFLARCSRAGDGRLPDLPQEGRGGARQEHVQRFAGFGRQQGGRGNPSPYPVTRMKI